MKMEMKIKDRVQWLSDVLKDKHGPHKTIKILNMIIAMLEVERNRLEDQCIADIINRNKDRF